MECELRLNIVLTTSWEKKCEMILTLLPLWLGRQVERMKRDSLGESLWAEGKALSRYMTQRN